MRGILLDYATLEQLRERYPRFLESAYLFILSSLHHVLGKLEEPRHISGRELTLGVRDLAIERYGPLARTVLEHWGIRSSEDVGAIVFALVEFGILIKQDEDQLDDFLDVFNFDEAFEADTT